MQAYWKLPELVGLHWPGVLGWIPNILAGCGNFIDQMVLQMNCIFCWLRCVEICLSIPPRSAADSPSCWRVSFQLQLHIVFMLTNLARLHDQSRAEDLRK